jgi:hypothetical protein
MGRRKTWKHAVAGNAIERIRDVIEAGGSIPEIEEELRQARLPKDAAERRRLANVCRGCAKEGHWYRECPTRECFACGEFGHLQRNCPNRTEK